MHRKDTGYLSSSKVISLSLSLFSPPPNGSVPGYLLYAISSNARKPAAASRLLVHLSAWLPAVASTEPHEVRPCIVHSHNGFAARKLHSK